jgi:hypothetical protein
LVVEEVQKLLMEALIEFELARCIWLAVNALEILGPSAPPGLFNTY